MRNLNQDAEAESLEEAVARANKQEQQKSTHLPEMEPLDLNDPAALRNLAKSALVEIVQKAPRNVSLVAAIRELLDRIDGKAPQSIALDVQDHRMDKMPIDRLLKLAAMLDEPVIISPMPQKIE